MIWAQRALGLKEGATVGVSDGAKEMAVVGATVVGATEVGATVGVSDGVKEMVGATVVGATVGSKVDLVGINVTPAGNFPFGIAQDLRPLMENKEGHLPGRLCTNQLGLLTQDSTRSPRQSSR
jgi:hypothetical protein